MGGFYFSPKFSPWMKCLWAALNFYTIVVTQFLGTIGYLLVSTSRPVRDLFYALLTSNTVLMAVLGIPAVTWYFKTDIEQILTLSEQQFFATAPVDAHRVASSKATIYKMLTLHVLSIGAFLLVHPFFLYFSADSDSLNDLDFYLFPHVWLGRVQTAFQYYGIFTIHFLAAAIALVTFVTFSIYVVLLRHEIHVAILAMENFISDFSSRAYKRFETGSTNPDEVVSQTNLQRYPNEDFNEQSELIGQELLSAIMTAIRAHQVLRKKITTIKPHIELLFSSVLLILVGDQCLFVYLMCSASLDNFLKTKEILGILYINIILFTYCYVGKLLDDAEKMISMRVNDIPWYHLSPQQRKTFYIFVCQTQQHMQFYAFGVYAMNMPIVLQNLKIVFSLFNILRQVLNK